MQPSTDDVRITAIHALPSPREVLAEFPCTEAAAQTVAMGRKGAANILHDRDDRLFVVVGPCSIHDPVSALDYAGRLLEIREKLKDKLEISMRVYFEKPRTTVGWKGLINDPRLDGSFHIEEGLRLARKLLLDVNLMGLPASTEFLDMITPQYIADLVGWGAIGARTTESQVHRELASGLSCPVGFKNGTDGNVQIAVDAVQAAGHSHRFLSVTKGGVSAIVETAGNRDCHVILRGGKRPNYDTHSVMEACELLAAKKLPQRVMIDASHANSSKRPERQIPICAEIGQRLAHGDQRVMGLMIESYLVGGRQDLGKDLVYGKSVTDACISWDETVEVLEGLADAVQTSRLMRIRQGA